MRVALSLLLAVLLAGGGVSAAALAANTDQWESARVVAEARAANFEALEDARAAALAERTRLAARTSEAQELLASTRTFLALRPGWADAALLTALTTAVGALEDGLEPGLPPGIPVIDIDAEANSTEGAAEWVARLAGITAVATDDLARLEGLVAAVGTGLGDVARAAVKAGGTSIAGMALAAEALRVEARDQLAVVADAMRSHVDVLGALTDYSGSWTALHDAQVAAQAAADAAAAAAAAADARVDSTPTFHCLPPAGTYVLLLSEDGTYSYIPGWPCWRLPPELAG